MTKADTIATKLLSFIIFFAGAQLLITTIRKLIAGRYNTGNAYPALAIYITVLFPSWVNCFCPFISSGWERKPDSAMLIANGKNMQNDVIISGSVLLGLIFIYIFKMPILDTITACWLVYGYSGLHLIFSGRPAWN